MRSLACSQNKGLSEYQRTASQLCTASPQPPPPPPLEAERQACDSRSQKARGCCVLEPRDWHPPPHYSLSCHTRTRARAPWPRPRGPAPARAPPRRLRTGRARDSRGRAGLVLVPPQPAGRALEAPVSGKRGRSYGGPRALGRCLRLGGGPGRQKLAAECARPGSCWAAAAEAAAGSATKTETRWRSERRRGRSRSPGRARGGAGGGRRRRGSRILKNHKTTLASLWEMTTKRWERFLVN
ncbi:putative uncharacterized protein encoded by LINC00612 [Ovis canadensis]|uniref:putative uncharacterized protein encoded by LINC00612 n=1 Tax=Ovis canadensis TaxID=37174 RepID=UPI003753B2B0